MHALPPPPCKLLLHVVHGEHSFSAARKHDEKWALPRIIKLTMEGGCI
jgi:hypothetical protein